MKKLFSLILFFACTASAANADRYKNFADLARHEVEGQAYQVRAYNRHSNVTVLAIHGGKIERGTAELANEIARPDFNLYTFIADLPGNNRRLHITSSHFDDPRALNLVKIASRVISIHGFDETRHDRVCIGGGNKSRSAKLAEYLNNSGMGLQIETPCTQFGGDDPQNIVNLGKRPGVQIELSTRLREKLLADPNLMKAFANKIRKAYL